MPEAFDAILLGSANAVRCGGPGIASLAGLPAYAVGEATAAAAREAGLDVVGRGCGGLQDLLPQLAADSRRRVLRLAGEERVPIAPPEGMRVETVVVYAVRPLPVSAEARRALGRGTLVLLHSAAAAARLAELCDGERIDRAGIMLACLGPRIAAAAGEGWRLVRSAQRPDDPALLALAAEMCQNAAARVDNNTTG